MTGSRWLFVLAALWLAPAYADFAAESFAGTYVGFNVDAGYSNFSITVTGPDGFHVAKDAAELDPYVDLIDGGDVPDGVYRYELTAASSELVRVDRSLDAGRGDAGDDYVSKGVTQSGRFRVVGGRIAVTQEMTE